MRASAAKTLPLALALAIAWTAVGVRVFAQRPEAPIYRIIVNPNNPVTNADRQFLEDAFLKKITRWPNDEVIRPADLLPNSPVRRKFTEDVLQPSVEALKGYRHHPLFSGRHCP